MECVVSMSNWESERTDIKVGHSRTCASLTTVSGLDCSTKGLHQAPAFHQARLLGWWRCLNAGRSESGNYFGSDGS